MQCHHLWPKPRIIVEENDSKDSSERCVFCVFVFSFLLLLQVIKKTIVAIIVVATGKKHGVATMKMSKMMMNAITLFHECDNFQELTIKLFIQILDGQFNKQVFLYLKKWILLLSNNHQLAFNYLVLTYYPTYLLVNLFFYRIGYKGETEWQLKATPLVHYKTNFGFKKSKHVDLTQQNGLVSTRVLHKCWVWKKAQHSLTPIVDRLNGWFVQVGSYK